MNTTTASLTTEVRNARSYDGHAASCDALDPCEGCKAKARMVRTAHLFGQDVPETPAPRIPRPRTGDLRTRLAHAHA